MLTRIIKATENDYPALIGIWERSVISTHDFLQNEDFIKIKAALPSQYFPYVDIYIIIADGNYAGFIGLSGDTIEMLFIDTIYHRQGLGRKLIEFALYKGMSKVDVNEQNTQALLFYQSMGFNVTSRDLTDLSGLPYPILHLSL